MHTQITIDGNNFSDLESFFTEIEKILTKGLNWKTGHNMNAFNDLLCGGFGVFEYEEPITISWMNFSKSKNDLGNDLANDIVRIIQSHQHIKLTLSR